MVLGLQTLPSFSIVLETENLANADIEGLSRSLASLVNQDLSPTEAREVILVESGDTPADLLDQLCQRYPWIKVHLAPPSTGYYKAKMLGAAIATGEVVVYCDSDCIYEPHWLRTILSTFAQNPEIQVVAGETTTRGVGWYGTAMALTYIFPQYSGETELAPTAQYFLNNVAFRREFLLRHPIPLELPLYRGNCVVHAQELTQKQHKIWRQPLARANHAPPDGVAHFFWRFLLIGHDLYWQHRLLDRRLAATPPPEEGRETYHKSMGGFAGKIAVFFERIRRLGRNDPRHLVYLPLAIPAATASVLLIFVGYLITIAQPDYLLKTYDRLLEAV